MSVFTNSAVQSSFTQFNGTSVGNIMGFGMYSSPSETYYYVMDYFGIVYILNDDWQFISFKNFTNSLYMISINNSLYMSGSYDVWKVDKDLTVLINYNYNQAGSNAKYLGISYNPSNSLIYVTSSMFSMFSSYYPWSITVSSNQLYVGLNKGIILVFQNEIFINQFDGCNGDNVLLSSILFDQNGYMATSCYSNKSYLFSPSGSFTGKYLTIPRFARYIGFDSKDRFILTSIHQIVIYN